VTADGLDQTTPEELFLRRPTDGNSDGLGLENSCRDPTETGRFRNVFAARRSEKQARRAQFRENKRQLAAAGNTGGSGKRVRLAPSRDDHMWNEITMPTQGSIRGVGYLVTTRVDSAA
jgi:hypothetical protein